MLFLRDWRGGQGQGQPGSAGAGSLIAIAGQLIDGAGDAQGLVNTLQQHGLGGAVQSWVGVGTNEPVSGDQLGHALQGGGFGGVAQEAAIKWGADPSNLLARLLQVLPPAVDQLTPGGPVADAGQGGGFNLGMLEGLAGKLMGAGKA